MLRALSIMLIASAVGACSPGSPVGFKSILDVRTTDSIPKFGDSDPVDWPTRTPWTYPVHGIDVAKYQGDIDWKALKKGGVSFAFIKATEGDDHSDKKFQQNWANSGRVGMPRGAYHFYYFCSSASDQANWYIRNVPKDANALPPVLDMEWNHQSKCKAKQSASKIRSEMRTFLKKVHKHYGKRPIIYTTVDFYKDNRLSSFKGYEFWLRSVADHPKQIYPGQNWSFWQYSGTGRVPGITGDTDLNVFAGSKEAWLKWVSDRTGGSTSSPTPPVAQTLPQDGIKLPPVDLPKFEEIPVASNSQPVQQPFPLDEEVIITDEPPKPSFNSLYSNRPSHIGVRPNQPLTGMSFTN